jgi:hypothetical protein
VCNACQASDEKRARVFRDYGVLSVLTSEEAGKPQDSPIPPMLEVRIVRSTAEAKMKAFNLTTDPGVHSITTGCQEICLN